MNHILNYKLFEAKTGEFEPLLKMVDHLEDKKVVFITTSNRWDDTLPKSTQLAEALAAKLTNPPLILDAFKLKIHTCEGNVSHSDGNHCGVLKALLKDDDKNPNKFLRCWASVNNADDELWKIAKAIYDSDVVIFFGSIRWGSMNSTYQKLLERLTWIENRHSSLGESNVVKDKEAGLVVMGHNWRGADVLKQQQEILGMYGFKTPDVLYFNYQWTEDSNDETLDGYKKDSDDFDSAIIGLE